MQIFRINLAFGLHLFHQSDPRKSSRAKFRGLDQLIIGNICHQNVSWTSFLTSKSGTIQLNQEQIKPRNSKHVSAASGTTGPAANPKFCLFLGRRVIRKGINPLIREWENCTGWEKRVLIPAGILYIPFFSREKQISIQRWKRIFFHGIVGCDQFPVSSQLDRLQGRKLTPA